jgi:hypothetical protein
MIDPAVHCLPDVCAEAAAAESGLFGQKLAIDPGGTQRLLRVFSFRFPS